MKKMIIALVLLVSGSVFAQSVLQPGQSITLDVADQPSILSFGYVIHTDNDEALQFKIKNKSGFECFVVDSHLKSRSEKPSRPAILEYEFSIHWLPGADLSSCEVRIQHSDADQDALLRLEMNY